MQVAAQSLKRAALPLSRVAARRTRDTPAPGSPSYHESSTGKGEIGIAGDPKFQFWLIAGSSMALIFPGACQIR
jgi:hypothetical protein